MTPATLCLQGRLLIPRVCLLKGSGVGTCVLHAGAGHRAGDHAALPSRVLTLVASGEELLIGPQSWATWSLQGVWLVFACLKVS